MERVCISLPLALMVVK